MATEKALYWIAICVMVIGLGDSFVNHHRDLARNFGQKAMMVADLETGQAQGQMGQATGFVDRTQMRVDRAQAAADRVQARMACIQTRIARRQAALARAEALQARFAVAQNVKKIVVTVPEIPAKTIVVRGWDNDFDQ